MTMTWKDFKEKVEAAGVKDEDAILYIDVSGWDVDDMRIEHSRKVADASDILPREFKIWDYI